MDNNTNAIAERRPRDPAAEAKRRASRKRAQIFYYVQLALILLMLISQISAVVAVCRLGMLPTVLVILIILVFLAYDCLVGYFMFLRGKKVPRKMAKKVTHKRRLIASVLALIMLIGCVVISRVANDVRKTFEAAQKAQQEQLRSEAESGIKRTVYVRSFDTAESLADAASYSFGILEGYDDENTAQAVAAIEAEIGSTINTKSYLSVFEMANALMAGQLDAMVLNSGYISILEADDRYSMFSENTRVLADVKIEGSGEELDGSGLLLNAEADIAENGKLKPFIMYISGSDSREGTLDGNTRSDVNILAVVNPETRQVLLLNTPRDYYVPMPRAEGTFDKLTHCGVYGISCSMQALAALYEHDIQYYAQLNFEGLEKLVDAIGGITIESDVAFTLYQKVGKIKVGENNLNGKLALAYARTRKGLDGGDLARGNHQMQVIKAIVDKATSGTTIITNYTAIMDSIDGMFVMNVPMSLIGEVMKRQLADMSGWNIMSYTVRGEGGYSECYSAPGEQLYVLIPYESHINKAKQLIDMVINGETLTEQAVASGD